MKNTIDVLQAIQDLIDAKDNLEKTAKNARHNMTINGQRHLDTLADMVRDIEKTILKYEDTLETLLNGIDYDA